MSTCGINTPRPRVLTPHARSCVLSDRPAIPADVTREILIASGHRCAVCGAGCPLERAHIIPWHKSRTHNAEDLICLCASCHERADLERWGEKTLREYKEKPWILRHFTADESVSSKARVELTLAVELSDFNERNQRLIQYAIAAFLDISPNDVQITSVEESNSVKLTLELPIDSLEKLLDAHEKCSAELEEYLSSFELLDLRPAQHNDLGRLPKVNQLTRHHSASIGMLANPVKALANQFLRRSSSTLLSFGIAVSIIDFMALYAVAGKENVLRIDPGIGLFKSYALYSTIVANAVLPCFAKKYYDNVRSMTTSKAIVHLKSISSSLESLRDMIQLRGRFSLLLYTLIMFGALNWLSSVAANIAGKRETRWGYRVFDSPDHPLTFSVSMIHNFYTWLIILPLVAYVVIGSSHQLRQAIATASRRGAIRYDLLNPDRRGGFDFLRKAQIAFNVISGLVYIQILLYGFAKFSLGTADALVTYIIATVLLVMANTTFFGAIYGQIKKLRFESLDRIKDNVYKNDALSFEILKYCYERRLNWYLVIGIIIQVAAIILAAIGTYATVQKIPTPP